MPNAIHLELDWLCDVMADQFKTWMVDPLSNVGFAAGEVVIKANHLLTRLHQPINKVGAKKARPAGYQIAQRADRHKC